MPYEKGHRFHPRKDGSKHPGQSKIASKVRRTIAMVIRGDLDAELFKDYYLAIASRKPGVKLAQEEDEDGEPVGDFYVTWDREGIPPSNEEVSAAVKELVNRGWGLPAQSIHLEADFKHQTTTIGATLDLGALPAGSMRQILDVITKPRELPAPAPHALPGALASAIDARSIEVPSPAGAILPAGSIPGAPASTTHAGQHDPRASSGSLDLELEHPTSDRATSSASSADE